ncbi:hypothetical protein C826_02031 [Helicobacter bilis WiWa]|uniref:Uncharacterized protein n=1 Tax=Helicobacter bilis WiWa TaxID=1235804 RepID=N2BAS1_9HELI|nr:hypothetical protein C826_02031 [Helicobacter bilis WiWa]
MYAELQEILRICGIYTHLEVITKFDKDKSLNPKSFNLYSKNHRVFQNTF